MYVITLNAYNKYIETTTIQFEKRNNICVFAIEIVLDKKLYYSYIVIKLSIQLHVLLTLSCIKEQMYYIAQKTKFFKSNKILFHF